MKTIIGILKWGILSVITLILLIFILLLLDQDYKKTKDVLLSSKTIHAQKEYSPTLDSNQFNSLLETYGNNKILAPGFELQCLLALSHYPELKETPIEFQVKPAIIPLSSRPDPLSVLFPWIQRKYLVIISNETNANMDPILLHKAPFNAQIGIIGHELGHSVYYLDKSALQLAQIAYKYEYDRDFHNTFERDTDKRGIAHGLGYQLYDFAFFVRIAFGDTKEEIAQQEGGTYLSPKEITSEMEKYHFYIDPVNDPDFYFSSDE